MGIPKKVLTWAIGLYGTTFYRSGATRVSLAVRDERGTQKDEQGHTYVCPLWAVFARRSVNLKACFTLAI